ncbi:MAG: histidine phosphatase family protein [Anaerolineaceae bacterium]
MTTILLIRHGLNDWVGKKLVGRIPGVHLNKSGENQAKAIASVLKEIPISAIYSSPLERAFETALPLSLEISVPIITNDALQEIDFGEWQGKSIKQLRRLKLWKTVQNEPEKMRFPGGESFVEAQIRLSQAVESIYTNHSKDEIILCFSHSDSIRLIVAFYLGIPINQFHKISIDTASISVLVFMDGLVKLPYINQIVDKPFNEIFRKSK